MTRVLLVDDQALVRSGFRIILESEPGIEVVGEAANGREAIERARELSPDVICMDVEMPEMNGIEAARQILGDGAAGAGAASGTAPGAAHGGERARPAILILTTFGHDHYLFDALAAGVSGFLLKTSRAEQLIDAIRTLAAGQALLGPDVTRSVIDRIAKDRAASAGSALGDEPATDKGDHADPATSTTAELLDAAGLTEREREVLEHVARGLSNAEIAKALFLGESTVKTHVSNLLQKLGARDRIQAVVWAHTAGLT